VHAKRCNVRRVTDLRKILAGAVRAERSRAGLTQGQLAQALGWERHAVTAVEAGARAVGVHELPSLCRALGVTLDRLLVDADPDDRDAIGV
jgi:transcriptional regulator with XRE-family HTH domain